MMKLKTIVKWFPLTLFLFLTFSCDYKPDSKGEFDEIYVFADSVDWPYYKEAMNDIFGKEYRTPVLEREYLVKWVPFRLYKTYKHYRNLFFLARLDSELPVSLEVRNLLPKEMLDGFRSGEYFYVPKQDPWAMDQFVVFMVANSKEDMLHRLYDMGELVYQEFERSYYNRLKRFMFARYENKELEQYLLDHFPFTMRIQHDYFIADESLEHGYVWIRRLNPDRSILVHWLPYTPELSITPRWIIDERNRLAAMVYEGDVVVENETVAHRMQFKGWSAYRLEGTWKNPRYVIGGPFRNITFVDLESGLVFMIDYYVQAVGMRKKIFLDQLEIMAHTFQTKVSLQQQKNVEDRK